jgi:hypothetical protein
MSVASSLPYSQACERNKEPILEILKQWFLAPGVALEIGSGTAQHAVHFAQHLPHLIWQPTDRVENLAGIQARVNDAALANLNLPIELDVRDDPWRVHRARFVFSANTCHIMGWPEVELMFAGIERVLQPRGYLVLYGPFNRKGRFTSESNQAFDQMLRARDPASGIRDDQAMFALAARHGLTFAAEYSMPARNRILVWSRS